MAIFDLQNAPRTLRRKLRGEVKVPTEAGFPAMGQKHYLLYLAELHKRLRPRAYFEIGTESGASLSFATCTSIAVDPHFQLQADVSRNKPELHQFQGPSDDFFAKGMLDRLGYELDFAFLDGMHLFEFLLRDFMNTERHMSPDGLVVMHDCVPFNRIMAERYWDRAKTVSWTGDVWKVVAILREYRPDLTVEVVDTPPTGLVCIKGLDPKNTVLTEAYDEIIAKWTDVSIDDYGVDALTKMLDVQPVELFAPPVLSRKTNQTIAIKTCTPNDDVKESWGDYHYAKSLAAGFEKLGHKARVDLMDSWMSAPDDDMLDLVLQGHDYHQPRGAIPSLMWLIYPGKRMDWADFGRYHHVFVASDPFAERIRAQVPDGSYSVLHQAFDPAIMKPGPKAKGSDLVFVGNNHFGSPRPVVDMALKADHPLSLWGQGWEGRAIAERLDNKDLGKTYGKAGAVLCDHTRPMARNGFLSNRVFDALACGAPVIMDHVNGLPEEFAPYVHVVDTPDTFEAAVASVAGETAKDREARLAFAKTMATRHTFEIRAKQILDKATALSLI